MGQGPSTELPAPIIDVGYDELTYRMLEQEIKKEQLTFTPNRPQSAIQRTFMDLFGSLLIYAGTFIVCDVMRTMQTGRWTRLEWMFLGPWNYITGAPLLHKLTHLFDAASDKPRQLTRCEHEYSVALKKCELENPIDPRDRQSCDNRVERDYRECYTESAECQTCVSDYLNENPWGKTECYDVPGLGLDNDQYCIDYPPTPSETDAENYCLGELGFDPQ